MLSVSVCCIPVDASFAECDVSTDEKSTPPCTHPDSSHHLTSCLVLVKRHTPKKERETEKAAGKEDPSWSTFDLARVSGNSRLMEGANS